MAPRVAVVVVAAVCVIAHTALAQSRWGSTQTPGIQVRSHAQPIPPPPPQPPPSSPNTTSGIAQLPPIGGIVQFPTMAGANDVFRATQRTFAPRFDRPVNRYQRFRDPFGYVSGSYGGYLGGYGTPEAERRPEAPAEFGFLRLNVSPGVAQVYVDGFYLSTVDGFNGTGPARAIEAGPHRVEIRADGYETVTFDVRIVPNETIGYRRDLKADEPVRQARNFVPAVPKTFYVIPKCYAGDKRPSADELPKGCRASNLRAIPPVVERAR